MQRWVRGSKGLKDIQEVTAYLEDLIAVGRKHGMSLSHEDTQGAFVVMEASEENERWLVEAWDGRDKSATEA